MRLVEIFDDGERLDQNLISRCDQGRHPHLRIDHLILGPPMVAAVLDQMDRYRVVGEPLEVERNTNAIGGDERQNISRSAWRLAFGRAGVYLPPCLARPVYARSSARSVASRRVEGRSLAVRCQYFHQPTDGVE